MHFLPQDCQVNLIPAGFSEQSHPPKKSRVYSKCKRSANGCCTIRVVFLYLGRFFSRAKRPTYSRILPGLALPACLTPMGRSIGHIPARDKPLYPEPRSLLCSRLAAGWSTLFPSVFAMSSLGGLFSSVLGDST